MESGDGESQDLGDESKDVGDESQDVGDESKDVDVKLQNVEGGSQDVGGGSQDVEGGSQDDDDIAMRDDAGALQDGESVPLDEVFVCQYCDREIVTSERLLRHEMQHLIGNHYEVISYTVSQVKQEIVLLHRSGCSSVVRAFAYGAMGRQIDPSWSTH